MKIKEKTTSMIDYINYFVFVMVKSNCKLLNRDI
jgi:hypothetical protein